MWRPGPPDDFTVAIVAAGTADRPVAAEARAVAAAIGMNARHPRIGRVLRVKDELSAAQAVIVVAGMEGALAWLA